LEAGVCTVGDGTVVGFFVVAVLGEGVGDACEFRLDDAVLDGIVEGLRAVLEDFPVGSVVEQATYWPGQDLLGLGRPCPNELRRVLCVNERKSAER
jgi:hypothetical protein